MREFFQGWRRKVGCVTLVMACVVAIAWGRSYFVEDRVAFTRGGFRYAIGSSPGSVTWDHWLNRPPVDGLGWSSGWRDLKATVPSRPAHFRARPESLLGRLQFESRSVPFWPFAVPLTLVSGYLMVWKPRSRLLDPPFRGNDREHGNDRG